jgi:hypothetical protein
MTSDSARRIAELLRVLAREFDGIDDDVSEREAAARDVAQLRRRKTKDRL